MELCLNDATKLEVFSHLFQQMKGFCEHVNLDFNAERVYIQTMDASKISILEVTVPASWFTSYTCTEPVVLGISSTLLAKLLATRDKGQQLTLTYDGEETDKLACNMTSSVEHKPVLLDKHFEMPLIELETETMGIPDIEYEVEYSLSAQQFATMIQQLKTFGDTVDVDCSEDHIEWAAKSDGQGKMMVRLPLNDLEEFTLDEGCVLALSFSLQQLALVAAYSKISKTVALHKHHEYPLRIDYASDELTIRYYLAPKVRDE